MSGIEIIPLCFIYITWPTAVTKFIHISYKFLNNSLLLEKYLKAHKLKYQISEVFFIANYLVTIIAFATGLEIKNLKSNSTFWIAT